MLESIESPSALPQNVEAERAVLGAVLIDNLALAVISPILRDSDFFLDTHRRIWTAIGELAARSAPIDLVTVRDEIDRMGAIDRVGGPAYLASLVDGIPDVANAEHYARIVKEKSTLRRLIALGQKITRDGTDADRAADDVIGDAASEIFDIAQDSARGGFVPLGEIAEHNLAVLEEARGRQGMLTGLTTGFRDLDRLTSGLQTSELIILAARPSVGKTSFALNIAQHVAIREARSVGFFSLEMSKEALGPPRALLRGRGQRERKVRDGFGLGRGFRQLVLAQTRDLRAPASSSTTPRRSRLPEMRAKCQRLKREHGLDLVVVDYLQLMAGHGRIENRTQEVSQISRGLKLLAKDLRVPVIALSQLSRAVGAADRRAEETAARRISGTRARSSRTPTSSSSSIARRCTTARPSGRTSPTSSSPSSATARPTSSRWSSCTSRRRSGRTSDSRNRRPERGPVNFSPRRTAARIDLSAIAGNFRTIRERSGQRVLAVVKANAYGHGAAAVARALEEGGANFFCVAIAEEGIELRRAGIRSPILLLNFADPRDAPLHRAFGLTPALWSLEQMRAFSAATAGWREPLPVHVKIDSGLARLGIFPGEVAQAAEILSASSGLRVEAAFSHFSHGEDPAHPTRRRQSEAAAESFAALRRAGFPGLWTHLANSGAALEGAPECEAVRPGLLLYGVAPSSSVPAPAGIAPALAWETEVMAVKRVPAGTPVGYGGTFVTGRPTTLAVLPIGYDDGYRRSFSGRAPVLFEEGAVPTVGAISMDLTVCDATDVPVAAGDRAVLLGSRGGRRVSAHDLARAAGTIPYEILCGIGRRVPRRYD